VRENFPGSLGGGKGSAERAEFLPAEFVRVDARAVKLYYAQHEWCVKWSGAETVRMDQLRIVAVSAKIQTAG
jgi:hypothetical protein